MTNNNVKLIHRKKWFFLLLVFLCTANFTVSYSEAAVTNAKEYVVVDGTTIELSVTVDVEKIRYEYDLLTEVYTLELKEGGCPFIVAIKLISIGSSYVGIRDIKIDYKYGNIEQYYIDHGSVQLTTPLTSLSETLDLIYLDSYESIDFEMKFSTTLITGLVDEYGTSNWDLFLTITPWTTSGLIYVYIFVPFGVVVIAGGTIAFILIRKKRIVT